MVGLGETMLTSLVFSLSCCSVLLTWLMASCSWSWACRHSCRLLAAASGGGILNRETVESSETTDNGWKKNPVWSTTKRLSRFWILLDTSCLTHTSCLSTNSHTTPATTNHEPASWLARSAVTHNSNPYPLTVPQPSLQWRCNLVTWRWPGCDFRVRCMYQLFSSQLCAVDKHRGGTTCLQTILSLRTTTRPHVSLTELSTVP